MQARSQQGKAGQGEAVLCSSRLTRGKRLEKVARQRRHEKVGSLHVGRQPQRLLELDLGAERKGVVVILLVLKKAKPVLRKEAQDGEWSTVCLGN